MDFFTGFPSDSQYVTERVLRNWLNMASDTRNKFCRIYNFSDIEILLDKRSNSSNKKDREIGIVLHFEGAAGIASESDDLSDIRDIPRVFDKIAEILN